MNITRWNRNTDFMSDLLNDFFREPAMEKLTKYTSPAVNIVEKENEFEIHLAAPGFNKEDFDIQVKDNTLRISCEVKKENETEDENYTRREYSYNSFSRSFNIPKDIDVEKISGSYENGELKLSLPKYTEAKTEVKQIELA